MASFFANQIQGNSTEPLVAELEEEISSLEETLLDSEVEEETLELLLEELELDFAVLEEPQLTRRSEARIAINANLGLCMI